MRKDTHWLLHFCYDNEQFTEDQLRGLVSSLDASTPADTCAKMLESAGWVEDTEFLKEALEAAKQNAHDGHAPPELDGIAIDQMPPETETEFPDVDILEAMSPEELRSTVKTLFRHCQTIGASDLHLSGGSRPRIRHHRKIVYLSHEILPDDLARRMNFLLLTDAQKEQFEDEGDLDYALTLDNEEDALKMRFRANLMLQKKGISGVYRIVTEKLQTLEELGFPNADTIRHLLTYHNGLILVTGPVNSGKTTTLATLVNELNESRQDHIITVEDPIEVMQESRSSIVTQREVGKHTASFKSALKSALREDPDIIVIGEMRDLETIEMAVTAAETGHLVIATMHTRDSRSTLNRMLDVFPSNQQGQIRAMTAGSLRGIVCQRLLPSTDDGVALACELMVNTPAVANIIRDGKDTGLESAMQSGRKKGMRTINESLDALVKAGKITEAVAEENRSHSDVKGN